MAVIKDGTGGSAQWAIGTDHSGRVVLYDGNGNALATAKGIQSASLLNTQSPKDAGRSRKAFVARLATPATADTMVSLTPVSQGVSGVAGTSFAVTTGKTLRILSITVDVKATAATIVAATFTVRTAPGVVTTASPVEFAVTVGTNAAVANTTNCFQMDIPDGLELVGTDQIGISCISSTASATIDVSINGFEY